MKNQPGKKILIIEDNAGDQLLLHENLKSTGLLIGEIIMVESLEEGKALIKIKEFDLLFLDLFLPDSEGLSSLPDLIKLNPKLPIIIYSGLSDTQMALHAITLGAQDFLIKGDYSNSLLEKTVRYSIERKSNLEALEQSIERYNLVSKATHDMVWDWNLISNEVYRNTDAWKKMFKTKEVREVGTIEEWAEKIHPEDRAIVEQAIEDAIKTHGPELFEAEFRIVRDDGSIGYIEDRGYIIRNDEGKAIRIIGASQDITERKIAEQKVAISEQRFKSLVQNSADLLAILNAEGNYIYVSPSSKIILGYEPDFFTGKSPFSFMHADDVERTMATLMKAGSQPFVKVPLFRFKNASGDWRWIESTFSNRMNDPVINGIVVNSKDVTERKIADDEIEKLSMVARNTLSGVFILDANRKIQWVNNAFTTITEYSLEDVIGKNPREFLYGKNPDPAIFSEVKKLTTKGHTYEGERLNYTKSGKPIRVWLQLQTLYNNKGEVKQYFGVQTDITHQIELEEKVEMEKIIKQKQITDAVYSAQESERSEMGREMHDNINQLLGATLLYINMAKKNNDERDSFLINASTYTMSAIEEIRKLSKTLITPLIKEKGLIDSVKDLAEDMMLVHPIQILITANNFIDDELSDKFILNIFRIIQEQINNIIKHAQAKKVHINIEDNSGKLLISVTDDGVGFDTSKRKNGVGITNIKSRCELFNGTLLLLSKPDEGTKLSLSFNKKELLIYNPVAV